MNEEMIHQYIQKWLTFYELRQSYFASQMDSSYRERISSVLMDLCTFFTQWITPLLTFLSEQSVQLSLWASFLQSSRVSLEMLVSECRETFFVCRFPSPGDWTT